MDTPMPALNSQRPCLDVRYTREALPSRGGRHGHAAAVSRATAAAYSATDTRHECMDAWAPLAMMQFDTPTAICLP
jgi:hypothetical protein